MPLPRAHVPACFFAVSYTRCATPRAPPTRACRFGDCRSRMAPTRRLSCASEWPSALHQPAARGTWPWWPPPLPRVLPACETTRLVAAPAHTQQNQAPLAVTRQAPTRRNTRRHARNETVVQRARTKRCVRASCWRFWRASAAAKESVPPITLPPPVTTASGLTSRVRASSRRAMRASTLPSRPVAFGTSSSSCSRASRRCFLALAFASARASSRVSVSAAATSTAVRCVDRRRR